MKQLNDLPTAFARTHCLVREGRSEILRLTIFGGWAVRGFGDPELAADLQRWESLLQRLPTGDYRI